MSEVEVEGGTRENEGERARDVACDWPALLGRRPVRDERKEEEDRLLEAGVSWGRGSNRP